MIQLFLADQTSPIVNGIRIARKVYMDVSGNITEVSET